MTNKKLNYPAIAKEMAILTGACLFIHISEPTRP